jgi:hypothetical protein
MALALLAFAALSKAHNKKLQTVHLEDFDEQWFT